MKIGIVMGRGIEGCGVTKHTFEFVKFLINNNIHYKVFCVNDKIWPRKNSININNYNIEELSLKNINQWIEELNSCDIVNIRSMPSKDSIYLDNWNKILEKVERFKVLIYSDHNALSLYRNGSLKQTILNSDMIFSFTEINPFSEYVKSVCNKKINIITKGMYLDEFNIDNDRNFNHLKFIGRCTSWKGLKDFSNFFIYCKKFNKDLMFSMEGIERSIAYVGYEEEYFDIIEHYGNCTKENMFNYNDLNNELINICGVYNNESMQKRLRKCGFGFQLSTLKPKFLKYHMEFTHMEIINCNVIPVFSKEWGDYTINPENNLPLTQCNTYTIWYDKNNKDKSFRLINELINNKALYVEFAHNSYMFYKKLFDPQKNYSEFLESILVEKQKVESDKYERKGI